MVFISVVNTLALVMVLTGDTGEGSITPCRKLRWKFVLRYRRIINPSKYPIYLFKSLQFFHLPDWRFFHLLIFLCIHIYIYIYYSAYSPGSEKGVIFVSLYCVEKTLDMRRVLLWGVVGDVWELQEPEMMVLACIWNENYSYLKQLLK